MSNDVPTYGVRRADVLCLSGGGYRAALFHLGALTRLNELGLLGQAQTIGAVAGGSILAALLAARIPWPLHGAFRDWPEAVAEPMRSIARRSIRGGVTTRGSISGATAEAALEERYARQLTDSLDPEGEEQPRLVFGAAGLALGEMGGGEGVADGLRWEIGEAADPGYSPELVADSIGAVRTDMGAFGEAELAVLENHGYLLADAAVRASSLPPGSSALGAPAPEPPHPAWMDEGRVRKQLRASPRRGRFGRLPWRRDHAAHPSD